MRPITLNTTDQGALDDNEEVPSNVEGKRRIRRLGMQEHVIEKINEEILANNEEDLYEE